MMNAFSNNRKLFVAANWKCSIESPMDADRLIESMNDEWLTLDENLQDCVEVSIHPPYCFLDRVSKGLDPSMAVGSQNMYDASFPNQGNTGATTCKMLSGLGCNWVLLGHSDRRNNLGESDELIAQKAALALEEGLGIVLTLGEKKEERDAGQELAVLRKQLLTVADAIPNDADTWSQVVLAYEPVWAVGELMQLWSWKKNCVWKSLCILLLQFFITIFDCSIFHSTLTNSIHFSDFQIQKLQQTQNFQQARAQHRVHPTKPNESTRH